MHSGARVIHREKPEYGFGQVKYEEIDVLGEPRLQVSFEHLDHPLTLSPADVIVLPTASEDASCGRWGDLGELKRRMCCGLILVVLNLRLDAWMASRYEVSVAEIHRMFPTWIIPVLTLALVLWVAVLFAITRPKRSA